MAAIQRIGNKERDLDRDPITQYDLVKAWRGMESIAAFIQSNTNIRPFALQQLFMTSLARYVVLGSGRRGGKTFSAAFLAALFSCNKPLTVYQMEPVFDDYGQHKKDSMGFDIMQTRLDENGEPIVKYESTIQREVLRRRGVILTEGRPIIGCIMTPDKLNYPATYRMYLDALRDLVGEEGQGFEYNRNDSVIYIPTKQSPECIVYFKSAETGQKLRGDGYHWTWWDEPAFVKGGQSWLDFSASLTDLMGCGIFSTTPDGGEKAISWWFYDEFLDPDKDNSDVIYYRWYTIHNPHYPKSEWERMAKRMTPRDFAREYMGEWRRGGGNELSTDWLRDSSYNYYDRSEIKESFGRGDLDISSGKFNKARYKIVFGIDPAFKDGEQNDYTVITVLALDMELGQAFIVDILRKKMIMPDSIEAIKGLKNLWNPSAIGVESYGAQVGLVHMLQNDKNMGPVIPITAKGSKEEKIRGMSPLLKMGKIRIPKTQTIMGNERMSNAILALYGEVEEFPDAKHDDILDSIDIGVRTLGIIAPNVDLYESMTKEIEKERLREEGSYFARSIEALKEKESYNKRESEYLSAGDYDMEI
jgi:phage terminase large subunit-like protein